MFDKMIVSKADTAGSRGRSRYFLVSGLAVAALFLSAVVASIYAIDLDLGTEEFELSMMLAPVDPPKPEPPAPDEPRNRNAVHRTELPSRVVNMQRVDELPVDAPSAVSVNPNRYLSRPPGEFEINDIDSVGSNVPGEPGRQRGLGGPVGSSSLAGSEPTADDGIKVEMPPPPPVVKARPRTVVSGGVINGRATYLPTPPYPPAAKMINAVGAVSVQVMIDETGKVVSAKAVDGHPLLRAAAEKAAWQAKFTPTKLSNEPVKVTGVIIYNFKK
jgi:TonB family protein